MCCAAQRAFWSSDVKNPLTTDGKRQASKTTIYKE